eukprot:GFUD01043724.1.p1 GENE.GFUD01043724.1~~GFUD01043724.1.p1  ORF type:complete len:1350 (-),score=300.80 GFUD01043724.1:29-4078(-)
MQGEFSWVEAYQISYSNDGLRWSIMKNKNTQADRIFIGNYDSDSIVTQYFDELVNTRYLRIIPLKWHTSIGMRLEVIGCYKPYKPLATTTAGPYPPQVQTGVKTTTTEKPYQQEVIAGIKAPVQPSECTLAMKLPCQQIMSSIFSKGHSIINPAEHVAACEREICSSPQDTDSVNDVVCEWSSEYAEDCREAGVCQNWRTEISCPIEDCPVNSHYDECGPGCDNTCDDDDCDEPTGPGCYCDEDMVMLNGKCQPKEKCTTCKDQSDNTKYLNEEWTRDSCTSCICTGEGSVSCVTKTCEKKTCEVGFVLETAHSVSDTCCPHQVCVPAASQCQELVEPTCGEYQEIKTVLGSDNCPRYVCECVSICPSIDSTAIPLLDGEEYETDTTGCCASLKKVCKKENCPAETECSENLVKVLDLNTKDLCCPQYKCDIPRDKCLYTMKNEAIGEVIAKKVNETWNDGACRSCKCYARKPTKDCPDKPPESSCSVKTCDKRQMTKDSFKYVLEEIKATGVCCSEYKKTACKESDNVHQIGETWTGEDLCKKYSCVVGKDGEAHLEYDREKCSSKCAEGSTYKASSTECCGTCIPTGCVMDDGSLLGPGETKTDSSGCSKVSCKIIDGKAVTVKESEACPLIPSGCLEENIKLDQSGCCKICISCKDNNNGTRQVGDSWVKDKCSSCSCQADGSTSCTTKACEKKICELGLKLEVVRGTEEECCPKYTCIAEMPEALPLTKGAPVPQCPQITEPECGKFQEVKSVKGPDNCPRYVCECVKTCPGLEPLLEPLLPGEELATVTAGCCSTQVRQCKKENCPKQEKCTNYLEEKLDQTTKNDCCPQFICEVPRDKCIYTMKNEEPGTISVKQPGETWSDGPCESCSCMKSLVSKGGQSKTPESVCSVTRCDISTKTRSEASYVISNTTTPGECCAVFSRIACKTGETGNQLTKQIGESWTSDTDLCKSFSCVSKEGEAYLETSYTKCTQASDCSPGYEYQESPTECCGKCINTHCVMENGDLLAPGERKTDETGCKTTECKLINGKPSTMVQSAVCPAIPSDCPPQFLVPDQTGCCKVCSRPEKLKNCAVVPGGEDTVGVVEVQLPGHGPCRNLAPVADWTRCQGQCRSGSVFNSVEGRHINNCSCCQPSSQKEVTISLTCADGYITTKTVSVPTGCECLACLTEDAHVPQYQVEQIDQSHAALVRQENQVAEVSPEDIFGPPQSNAQLTQEDMKQSVAEVSPGDIFGVPQAQLVPERLKDPVAEVSAQDIFGVPQAQLVPERLKDPVAEVSAQDIFGVPQAQLVPERLKDPIAEVSAQDIFGIPDSEVQVAPPRKPQANLVQGSNQNGGISADDIFGLN